MTSRRDRRSAEVGRRQSVGCLGIAGFAALMAGVCLVLGFRCVMTTDTFNCFGLLVLFPAIFGAVAVVAFALGFRRFVTPEQAQGAAPRPLCFGAGWQTVERPPDEAPARMRAQFDVIHLPGHDAGAASDGERPSGSAAADSEDKQGADRQT